MERRIEFSLRELFTTNERTNERTNKRTNERTNERRQSGSDAVSGNIVVRVLEQCRDRTVPRARTQRKEGSIRALVWSYCSRALSSDQGMNIERSNPAWPELFRPSPPSRRVLVSPLPSSPPLSLSLSLSPAVCFLAAAEPLPFSTASTKSRSRVNTHPFTPSLSRIAGQVALVATVTGSFDPSRSDSRF